MSHKDHDEILASPRPFASFIRIDVAHLVHAVSLWKCFQNVSHPEVKEFYIRCVTLMVDCQDFHQLEKVFSLTCTVCIHKYNGMSDDIGRIDSAETARTRLESFMKKWKIENI